jgi:hypothetical protein
MDEMWTKRFEKLEPWIAKNPEGVHQKAVAALIARAKDGNDEHTMRMCWNAILTLGRGLEDWPLCRCGKVH